MTRLPDAAASILETGVLCYLASPSPAGPHTTPVVFALEGGRIWGTTGRRTTKAKLWGREPLAGGLVRAGDRALTFRGTVTMYDLLNPSTWVASVLRSRQLTMAAARFTAKNARFFAGYARDAAHVPLTWTPPARILFSVDVTSGAIIERKDVVERWGSWGSSAEGLKSFRSPAAGLDPSLLPEGVRSLAGEPRPAVLAMPHADGPVVLPAEATAGGSTFARVPRSLLDLADVRPSITATLVVDHASAWRATEMRGVMLRGPASVFIPDRLTSGRRQLEAKVANLDEGEAAVRLRPRSAVWWLGWSSGTVTGP